MTETTTPRHQRWTDLGVVGTIVDSKIGPIQARALKNQPSGVAALARLRRGVGKPPGTVQDILEYTFTPEFAEGALTDDPTVRETAAHVSMTLYAMHQQSQRQPMHRRGYGLGRSVRQLNGPDVDGPPSAVRRRFIALGTADDLDELVHHARGMVQLLRAHAIPLDYALLADQLVRWQYPPDGPAKVRRIWGRDFYRTTTSDQPPAPDTALPESD
ncbi:MAG TPA: type I-E CRISPR-associated protein Cse2/CasB [Pseudonocardiaceae bacterium]